MQIKNETTKSKSLMNVLKNNDFRTDQDPKKLQISGKRRRARQTDVAKQLEEDRVGQEQEE